MAILGLYNKKKSSLTPTSNQTTYSQQVFNDQRARRNSLVNNSLAKTALGLPKATASYLAEIVSRAASRSL